MLLKEDIMLNYINYKLQIKFKQETDFIFTISEKPLSDYGFPSPLSL